MDPIEASPLQGDRQQEKRLRECGAFLLYKNDPGTLAGVTFSN